MLLIVKSSVYFKVHLVKGNPIQYCNINNQSQIIFKGGLSQQPIVIMNPWVHGNSKAVVTDNGGAYDNLEEGAGDVGSENFTPIE